MTDCGQSKPLFGAWWPRALEAAAVTHMLARQGDAIHSGEFELCEVHPQPPEPVFDLTEGFGNFFLESNREHTAKIRRQPGLLL